MLMIVSCSPANLWQKAGITEPEKVGIELKLTDPSLSDSKLDVASTVRGEGESMVSFSLDKPEGFQGKVLSRQSMREAERMAEALGARCYSKEEMVSFLKSRITDEEYAGAVRNTVVLVEHSKNEIKESLTAFLPEISTEEDEKEEIKELIEVYNELRESVRKAIDSIVDYVFSPLSSIITSESVPLWGDAVRCQLAVDVLGGILDVAERIVVGISDSLTEERIQKVDLSDEASVEEFFTDVASRTVINAVSGTLESAVPPFAVYNNIASRYGDVLDLKPLTDILKLLEGDAK